MCLTVVQLPLMELQILLFLSQSRPQAPRCLLPHCRVQQYRKKIKCYCTITNLVLSLFYPFCFPRHFFPSLTDLYIWLTPSSSPMLRVYTISMTANSGNFSAGSQQVTPVPRAHSHPLQAVGPLSSPWLCTACSSSHLLPHFLHSAPLRLLQLLQTAGAGTFIVFGVPFV